MSVFSSWEALKALGGWRMPSEAGGGPPEAARLKTIFGSIWCSTNTTRMEARISIPTKSRRQYYTSGWPDRQNASETINSNQKSTTILHFRLARSPECKRNHQFQQKVNDNTTLSSSPIARMQARPSIPTKSRRPYDTFFPAG